MMVPSPPRLRLLVISPFYPAHGGGVELVAGQLAAGLAVRGFDVTWAASDTDLAPDGPVRCVAMRSGNAIERRTGVPVPIWSLGALRLLWRLLRECDAVLMHESLYVSNVLAAAAARGLCRPLVVVQHVAEVPYRSRMLRIIVRTGNAIAARLVHRCAARVTFVSAVVQDYFRTRATASRQVLIPNGLDPALFHPVADNERQALRSRLGLTGRPTLLFVGRFVEKKGLALLKALALARPEWDWVFIGSGPLDPAGWSYGNVRVIGRVAQEQLPHWYRAADLLVLPSTGEGFPLVVQEAMACGLPVAISSDTAQALDGVREVAFSAQVAADPSEDLARWLALLEAALGQDLAVRRVEASRFASERWSWQRCADQYAEVIREVAPSAPRA